MAQVAGQPAPTAMSTGHKLHDPNVSFEEYLYWAQVSRADERYEDPNHDYTFFGKVIKKSRHPPAGSAADLPTAPPAAATKGENGGVDFSEKGSGEEKDMAVEGAAAGRRGPSSEQQHLPITDDEYVTASRALRTATWGAVFYLITTDILGPFSVPWAFAAMGYGPAIVLYTVFGFLAAYGGFLLWRMFLGLDSDRYPLKSYGDVAFRVYGGAARHVVNVLQSVQLLFNVGILVVLNGLSLEEIVTGSPSGEQCFIILVFVWAIAGAILGQIRTLRNLGWLANFAIWLNAFTAIAIMAVVSRSGVVAEAAIAANTAFSITAGDPISTTAGERPGLDFTVSVTGLMQAVYSYGGAMLFVEFMSEMRRPFDFWKGMLCAQIFIYLFYLIFGLVVYSYQGQYTLNPAYQGVEPYGWQTALNSIQLVTSLIAALLYGNVGIKVLYNNVLMDLFGAPSLGVRAGKLLWVACVPVYWGVAFIIASAIPQVSNLSALIGAACILQFSYTFPPWLFMGYVTQRDAMLEGDGFDPTTGSVVRQDRGWKRMARGFTRRWWLNGFNMVFFLGAATTAILGIYSAAIQLREAYSSGASSSFSCSNPYSS